jgi:hypothetical protein
MKFAKIVPELADKVKWLEMKGVTKSVLLRHLADMERRFGGVESQRSDVNLRQGQEGQKAVQKYLADLADQVKSVEIKALTTVIVVRHLADQKCRTWRSRFDKLTAGKSERGTSA